MFLFLYAVNIKNWSKIKAKKIEYLMISHTSIVFRNISGKSADSSGRLYIKKARIRYEIT